MITDTPFAGAQSRIVVNAKPVESLDGTVIHADRDGNVKATSRLGESPVDVGIQVDNPSGLFHQAQHVLVKWMVLPSCNNFSSS